MAHDDDPPPRRLRRREEDDDPPPRRLRPRPPADEFEEPRPRRRPPPEDYDDDPRPRRRRPRYEDDDEYEDDYDDRPHRRRRGPYAPCPHCRCPGFADKVTFTWWGGLIGPAMFSHVTCRKCGRGYNGKTGKDNTTAITIYVVGGAVLTLVAIVFLLFVANLR